MSKSKIKVAVLAATGSVGQRFVQLLDNHPWFEAVAVTASERSAGRSYVEACHWVLPDAMPAWAGKMPVIPTTADAVMQTGDVKIVFSALPADVARTVEPEFAARGMFVCSNASAYRKEIDVPILLPEVNPEHLQILSLQQRKRGWKGAILTNPNCTSTGMTVALKPLLDAFGLARVFAVSMQAVSGAGYPGVASLDILDNVVPYIGGEEEKVEWEPRKMLGAYAEDEIKLADFTVSAHTNRVAVTDGHIVCLSVELKKKAGAQDVVEALRNYALPTACKGLPSNPDPVILYRDEADRPQTRIDRLTGKGMTTVVGRLRSDPLFDYKLVTLSHNTIRGAAGGSLYNAELLVQSGWLGGLLLTRPVDKKSKFM